jgi:hypothetical protein
MIKLAKKILHLSSSRFILLLLPVVSAGKEHMIYHFAEPEGINYGREVLAPMRGGVRVADIDGNGQVDLIADGWRWIREGELDGMSVYHRKDRVSIPGVGPIQLEGDARSTITIRGDKFVQFNQDNFQSKSLEFTEVGLLAFAEGGDLRLAGSSGDEWGVNWILHDIADLDNDGRPDLLVSQFTAFELDGDTAYAPQAMAGYTHGWRDGRWVFHDFKNILWWFRNTGTSESASFSMAQMVLHGEASLAVGGNHRSFSARALDWNGNGLTDLLVHMGNRSVVFLGKLPGPHGQALFEEGRLLRYGGRMETDERKQVAAKRGEDGLLRIFHYGGAVIREAVQLCPDDPYSFSELRWVLFRNPNSQVMDIFGVPNAVDWNGNGRKDIIAGGEAGFLWYFENLCPNGGKDVWAEPRLLEADGEVIRLFKAENVQGPEELLIGYSNPKVIDWNLNGKLDILCGFHGNTVMWFENIGTRSEPVLTARGPIIINEGPLAGQPVSVSWRQRPAAGDVTGNGLPDLMAADTKGILTLWPRSRDNAGNLIVGSPEHPLDVNGNTFQMTPLGRGSGRAKSILLDWENNGMLDLITSPPLSVGARTDFIYRYKNLGYYNGVLKMEFRPREIKVSGIVMPGKFTHFRMVEPVDWYGNGSWQGIAGTCGRDPGIRNTWFYFWPEVQMSSDVFDESEATHQKAAVGRFRSMPLRRLPPDHVWSTPWKEWRNLPFANLFRRNADLTEKLIKNNIIFTNRDYVFNDIPAELEGLNYIPGFKETPDNFVSKSDGVILLLVPKAMGPFRNFFAEQAALHGFRKTDIPDFILYGNDPENHVSVMAAEVSKGSVIVIGSWAIPLFKETNE